MPERVDIGAIDDFPPRAPRVVQVGHRNIGVFNLDGRLYALPNVCPHQRGPLCEGRVAGTLTRNPDADWRLEWVYDGEVVICPWHLLEFHIPTGRCLAYDWMRVRVFPVAVEDGRVLVEV